MYCTEWESSRRKQGEGRKGIVTSTLQEKETSRERDVGLARILASELLRQTHKMISAEDQKRWARRKDKKREGRRRRKTRDLKKNTRSGTHPACGNERRVTLNVVGDLTDRSSFPFPWVVAYLLPAVYLHHCKYVIYLRLGMCRGIK